MDILGTGTQEACVIILFCFSVYDQHNYFCPSAERNSSAGFQVAVEVFKEAAVLLLAHSSYWQLILTIFNIKEKIHTCKKGLIAGLFFLFFYSYFMIL